MKESDRDRQIHALKTLFASLIKVKIEKIRGIRDLTIVHPQLARSIIITFKHMHYKVRVCYDMDTKQFQEPYTSLDTIDFAINKGKIAGFYDTEEIGKELRWRVVRIMEYCYEVSKMHGFGTTYGGNWANELLPHQLAEMEYERLFILSNN